MHDVVRGYSRGLYSNWLWHRPLQLVIDAGEGLTLALGSQVFAPAVIAITHAHSDHVLGLPGVAGARRFGKGAQEKPYAVLYPAGAAGIEAIRSAIAGLWPGVVFPIDWRPLAAGEGLALSRTRRLEAFAVTHVPGEPALGYRVLESRRRLKPEHAHLGAAEIERQARLHKRDALMEDYEHVVFAHSGDAMPIDPAIVHGADLLVHDATFLGAADRRAPIHATTEEAIEVARAAAARALLLHHLSVRYDRATAIPRLRAQLAASGFAGPCWLLDDHALIDLR